MYYVYLVSMGRLVFNSVLLLMPIIGVAVFSIIHQFSNLDVDFSLLAVFKGFVDLKLKSTINYRSGCVLIKIKSLSAKMDAMSNS